MEKKNIILIAIVAIAIIAVAAAIFTTMGGGSNTTIVGETSKFSNSFMEGSFSGKTKLVNNSSEFMQSYEDSKHKITYNISTVDNSTALMDIYYLQGVMNPEKRTLNGNDWNIYFSQAIEGNNTNKTLNIVICQCQKEKQGYLIYMIIDSKTDLNISAFNTFGEVYKGYVEPLLKSVTLKESKNVPSINDEFGLTADEFAQQMELVRQYKAGNTSALNSASQEAQ
ncbi:MAG: hypothetical protein UHW99_00255 [Methanobrevibacter sp.]|uniref:hypothetical protein n=1 Tax=uncultured Methanobrevibacter sp. TaxID=253161 RepID=UPI0025EF9E58|nr:hypothetical protein [uncultured Methanobrevibacter sp.]MEE1128396.1 hypothetical protein [Methanobrevibacter sp.]